MPNTTNNANADDSRETEKFLRWAALVGIDHETAMSILGTPKIKTKAAERAAGQTLKFPTAQDLPSSDRKVA